MDNVIDKVLQHLPLNDNDSTALLGIRWSQACSNSLLNCSTLQCTLAVVWYDVLASSIISTTSRMILYELTIAISHLRYYPQRHWQW